MARVPLRGATLGVAGYGSIGRAVAHLAKGFDMRVLATKRTPAERRDGGYTYPGAGDPEGAIPERIYGPEDLEEMVGQCDSDTNESTSSFWRAGSPVSPAHACAVS